MSPQQQQGVAAYINAAKEHGLWQQGKLIGVKTEDWREEFYRRSTVDTPAAKRKSFQRLRSGLAERGILVVHDDINRLNLPDAQQPKPPLGVVGDAIAGVLMRDSGTLAGQSRDMSQTYSGTDRTSP